MRPRGGRGLARRHRAGTCRQLVVKLADGTHHRANFKFSEARSPVVKRLVDFRLDDNPAIRPAGEVNGIHPHQFEE